MTCHGGHPARESSGGWVLPFMCHAGPRQRGSYFMEAPPVVAFVLPKGTLPAFHVEKAS